MKILYGTTNAAKVATMKRITDTLGIELISLNDLDQEIPFVDESGKDPMTNAMLKAKAYYQTFGMPVFSCDSGLYFDDLKEELQPGTHIRRVNGKVLNDEEMIIHYSALAKDHNGQLIGRYQNTIYFIVDDNTHFSSDDETLATEPFIITSKTHQKRTPGFPLDSLSIDIKSGQYYHDMKDRSVDQSAIEIGFKKFFQTVLLTLDTKCNK